MKLKQKLSKLAMVILMVFSAFPTNILLATGTSAAESVAAPEHNKTITANNIAEGRPNGDGTYTITLDVTGKSESSTESTKANVLIVLDTSGSMNFSTQESTTGSIGFVENSSTQLYCNEGGRQYSTLSDGQECRNIYYRVDYRDGRSDYLRYSGTRYNSTPTRLDVAKSAVNSLAAELLANNDAETPDAVEIALIDFASNVKKTSSKTTNLPNFQAQVNAMTAEGGTNWEAALATANSFNFGDNDTTHILFVSDGNPTFRNSRYNNSANDYNNQYGVYGTGNSDPRNYNFNAAKNVADTIVANSNKTLYSIGAFGDAEKMQNLTSGNYYDASNQQALNAAFADIISQITRSLNVTNIKIEDGVTSLTTAQINGNAGDFSYKLDGETWTNAPAATFDANSKTVTWDLGDYKLGNGKTASVSFVVYPDEEASDLVTDLKNGIISYENLSDEQKSLISTDGLGNYYLRTNTESPTLDYSVITSVTGEQDVTVSGSANYTNPDPILVDSTTIDIKKIWEDSLDSSKRSSIDSIELNLLRDGENYKSFTLKASEDWGSEVAITPGLMVSEAPAYTKNATQASFNGKTYAILREGHDYNFAESDTNKHYEFESPIYHPMLVDGTLMNVTFEKDANGDWNIAKMEELAELKATNVLKGTINVTKKVNGDLAPSDDQFEITVDFADNYTFDYRILYGTNNPASEGCESTVTCRSEQKSSTGSLTTKIYAEDIIQFVDVKNNTKFKVSEGALTTGYSLENIDYKISEGSDSNYQAAAAEDKEGEYYIAAGNTAWLATVNNKYETGSLKVSKTVVDGSSSKEFTFTLSGKELKGSFSYVKSDQSTGSISAGETFTLKDGENITISGLPIGAEYSITENAEAGYTADEDTKTGTIVKDQTQEASFTNTYHIAPSIVDISAKKSFNYWLNGEAFIFTLTGNGENQSARVLQGQNANFKVEISSPGTYNYTISEETSNLRTGVSKQGDNIIATVIATDNGDGTLNTSVSYTNDQTITNIYEANGEATIRATKVIDGRDWLDNDSFTFGLFGEDGKAIVDANGKAMEATVSKDNQSAEFTLNYDIDEVGTYTYYIREIGDMPSYFQQIGGDITATVTVTDNNYGQLISSVSYNQETITNRYSANGSIVLSANKEISGRDWLDSDSFTFALQDANGAVIETKTVDKENKTVNFNALNYSVSDLGKTYSYSIVEQDTPNYFRSSGTILVVVTLSDNGDGTISASAKYNTQTITNNYFANGEITLEVAKKMIGRDLLDGESYNFILENDDIELESSASKDKKASFTLNFDETDIDQNYSYTIRESGDMPAGVTMGDPTTVEISIKDNGDGTLSVEASNTEDLKIVNSYKAEPTSVVLDFTKTIVDESDSFTSGEYSFTITNSEGKTVDTQTLSFNENTNDTLDGEFKPLEFTEAGTYNYTISEVKGNQNGMTYDEKTYTVVITITDNYETAKLESSVEIEGDLSFTNIYKAAETTEIEFEVEKQIIGLDTQLNPVEFEFALSNEDGEVIDTANILGTGKTTLGHIVYEKAGTYTYTITETNTKIANFIYDETVYNIIVEVEDIDGKLEATISYESEENREGNSAIFINKYEAPVVDSIEIENPRTSDDFYHTISVFVVTLTGLIANLIIGRYYLKKAKQER